ncbi:MAG: hypothetical protein DRP09_09130 [Candidatus Thorarchaeota archaeon]|nr:MAG: hypothetical protein DRP09_09130 [Candidatus Thorarchaeota archaeon]
MLRLRILHVSHRGLPDHRIERAAYIAGSRGHDIQFLGLSHQLDPELDVFTETRGLRPINNRQAVLDKSIRRDWEAAVKQMKPDLIHANDIIVAKFSSNLGIPMVYDDHEYWSAQRIIFDNWPFWKRLAIRPLIKAIPLWEEELLAKHVTLTVSKNIAEEHRKRCKHVFLLRNLNLSVEIEGIKDTLDRDGIVYVGADFTRKRFAPHRNMTGLRSYLDFDALSGLTRSELYDRLVHYRFGLLPFLSTPYSKYINSAKTFDYLSCGLQVLMTRDLYEGHGCLPYTIPFDNYSELRSIIKECETADSSEIMSYARKNLVWECQADDLMKAYDIAMKEDTNVE